MAWSPQTSGAVTSITELAPAPRDDARPLVAGPFGAGLVEVESVAAYDRGAQLGRYRTPHTSKSLNIQLASLVKRVFPSLSGRRAWISRDEIPDLRVRVRVRLRCLLEIRFRRFCVRHRERRKLLFHHFNSGCLPV